MLQWLVKPILLDEIHKLQYISDLIVTPSLYHLCLYASFEIQDLAFLVFHHCPHEILPDNISLGTQVLCIHLITPMHSIRLMNNKTGSSYLLGHVFLFESEPVVKQMNQEGYIQIMTPVLVHMILGILGGHNVLVVIRGRQWNCDDD